MIATCLYKVVCSLQAIYYTNVHKCATYDQGSNSNSHHSRRNALLSPEAPHQGSLLLEAAHWTPKKTKDDVLAQLAEKKGGIMMKESAYFCRMSFSIMRLPLPLAVGSSACPPSARSTTSATPTNHTFHRTDLPQRCSACRATGGIPSATGGACRATGGVPSATGGTRRATGGVPGVPGLRVPGFAHVAGRLAWGQRADPAAEGRQLLGEGRTQAGK